MWCGSRSTRPGPIARAQGWAGPALRTSASAVRRQSIHVVGASSWAPGQRPRIRSPPVSAITPVGRGSPDPTTQDVTVRCHVAGRERPHRRGTGGHLVHAAIMSGAPLSALICRSCARVQGPQGRLLPAADTCSLRWTCQKSCRPVIPGTTTPPPAERCRRTPAGRSPHRTRDPPAPRTARRTARARRTPGRSVPGTAP